MAAPNAADVLIAKPVSTGGVLSAALGTTLPTSATASIAAFTGVGYVGEGGVVEMIDEQTKSIKAWGGDEVRVVRTSHAVAYKIPFIETNAETLALVYGDANVTATANGFAVEVNSDERDHMTWVLDMVDGDRLVRICIPDGQITDVADVTYVHDNATAYEVTLTCYPDASGNKAYKYVETEAS